MTFKKTFLNILFIAIALNFSCKTESKEKEQLIDQIKKSVDNYFTIKDEGEFIKSTYTGEYNEPFIGHVYEFIITQAKEGKPEFNYMAVISYDEGNESIGIVRYDFFILTNETDVVGWIEKRLKLNEAKQVK